MTPPELSITAIIYAIALILAQRGIAIAKPQLQEISLAIAPIVAAAAAAFLHYRTHNNAPPRRTVVIVGSALAACAILVGLFTQSLWHSVAHPIVAIPLGAIGAFVAPFIMFPLVERSMGLDTSAEKPKPIAAGHVTVAAVALVASMAIAFIAPTSHLGAAFVKYDLPGIEVSLPNWPVEERSALFEYGSIKLKDPRGPGNYISVHWSDSDRIQPDDYLKVITDMAVINRGGAFIAGHEGATFAVQNSPLHASVTIWNCPDDHRVLWLFSHLADSPESERATHDRVLETIRCHTGNRPAVKPVFPNFAPPSGFVREARPNVLSFVNAKEAMIVFTPASAAKSPIVTENVTPEKIASMLKGLELMSEISSPPTQQTVHDIVGHDRRVWSTVGANRDGVTVQVDLMVWYCDKRNMTFLGAYATRQSHPVQEGIDVLLPAVCHTSE